VAHIGEFFGQVVNDACNACLGLTLRSVIIKMRIYLPSLFSAYKK